MGLSLKGMGGLDHCGRLRLLAVNLPSVSLYPYLRIGSLEVAGDWRQLTLEIVWLQFKAHATENYLKYSVVMPSMICHRLMIRNM
jgi:hypothetical protein